MSKSLDYCKATAPSAYQSSDWDSAIEVNSKEIFDRYLEGIRSWQVSGTCNAQVDIAFDPDANFQYYTTYAVSCDGSLLFVEQAYEEIVARVCCLGTYFEPLGAPTDGTTVCCTVGNFVVLTEHSDNFAPADKPWMDIRTTVLLSIQMWYKQENA